MKANIRIMKNKPEITEEEIRNYMNFDGLVAKHHTIELKRRNAQKLIRTSTVVTVVAVVTASIYLFYQREPEVIVVPEKTVTTEPFSKPPEEHKEAVPEKKVETKPLQKETTALPRQTEKVPEQTKQAPAADSIIAVPSEYKEAEPVAGFPHLYEYFNSELKYPAEALKDSIQGVVTISFVINQSGKPEGIKIIQSLGILFDKEAYRLIEQMPEWRPALMNGKPVRAKISLPLTFRIEKTGK
jgi:TonB family protein